jgi:hypothetical protein
MSETTTTERDETPMLSAIAAATAISEYVAEMVTRAIYDPHASPTAQEKLALVRMRDELLNLASHEYDRGYRRAIALHRMEVPDDPR